MPGQLAQLCKLEGLGLCLGYENKNKIWQVFEQENIREENNGVLINFIERRRAMAVLAIMMYQISVGERTDDIFP